MDGFISEITGFMDRFQHFFGAYKQFGWVTGQNFVENQLSLEMQRCNMYKLYMFYIQNCMSNRNQSPLLQLGLMDPNLFFAEVLVVAMFGRMKVEMMKVERKKHPKLQFFVLFHACDRVGFQEK